MELKTHHGIMQFCHTAPDVYNKFHRVVHKYSDVDLVV